MDVLDVVRSEEKQNSPVIVLALLIQINHSLPHCLQYLDLENPEDFENLDLYQVLFKESYTHHRYLAVLEVIVTPYSQWLVNEILV